jgi:hypothetical protein
MRLVHVARPLGPFVLLPLLAACGPDVSPSGEGTSDASSSTTAHATSTSAADGSETGTLASTSTAADDTSGEPSAVDAHIDAWCQAWLSPECPLPRYDSQGECIEHYGGRLQPWIDAADAGELVFDEACAAAKVEVLVTGESSCPAYYCSLFVGTTAQAEPCVLLEHPLASECSAGLQCADGICQPSCVVLPEGGDCTMGSWGTCGEGLQCIFDGDTPWASGTCEPIPGPGDPCVMSESPCPYELWCDDGVCSDQYGGVGDSCATTPCDVAQGYCVMDVCVEPLPLGEPCLSWWQCASTACVADQCTPLPDTVGAPCHHELWCGGGLECDDVLRTCREPFTTYVCNWARWCPTDRLYNDVCDEGDGPDQCPEGSDAADCGYCPDHRQDDGECDEPILCAVGTDPDC